MSNLSFPTWFFKIKVQISGVYLCIQCYYLPCVYRFSVFCPTKIRPSWVKSARTCLTTSPMYIPEIIFSKICFPGFMLSLSTSRSHLVRMKSNSPWFQKLYISSNLNTQMNLAILLFWGQLGHQCSSENFCNFDKCLKYLINSFFVFHYLAKVTKNEKNLVLYTVSL